MPPTYVQSGSAINAPVTLAGTAKGNSLLVHISATATGSFSVNDSQGNVYHPVGSPVPSPNNNAEQAVFIAQNIPGGTVTVSITAPGGNPGLNVIEWSGVGQGFTVGPSAASNPGGSTFSLTAGPIVVTQNALLVAVYDSTFFGSAWSLDPPETGWTRPGGGVDYISLSPGSYSYTLSGSTNGTRSAIMRILAVVASPPPISLSYQPGFFDIEDSALACGKPLADYDLLKISYNSKLGVCRPEAFFSGYFTGGNTLPLPESPLDAYAYSVTESLNVFQLASTKPPLPGFTPGQETFPSLAFNGQPVNGFLVNPYELEPDFGTLTQTGFSTEKQLKLKSLFYEHGDTSTNVPEQPYAAGVEAVYCFGQRQSAPLDPILPGSVYQSSSTPTFYDFPDSAIYDGAPITQQMLQAISRNAKLGVFRFELFFSGYFRHGDTVPTPYGAGGYHYSFDECTFIPLLASSRQPTGDFVPGQVYFPQLANLDVYSYPASSWPEQLSIDTSTGKVTCTIRGANGVQGQGSVAVYCLAQRYPNLTMAAQPSFTNIADSSLVGGQVPTATLLQQLNNNAKFGIVATEGFWLGYFENGDTPTLPTSPVDGYAYSNFETLFIPIWVSSRKASGLTPGQKTWPTFAGDEWSGYIVASPYQCFVNQYKSPFGQLTATLYGSDNGVTAQGIASVFAICSRRQNITGTTL